MKVDKVDEELVKLCGARHAVSKWMEGGNNVFLLNDVDHALIYKIDYSSIYDYLTSLIDKHIKEMGETE